MALLKNSTLLALASLFAFAAPAMAQNYSELSRSDFISLSAGDAKRANTAIQTPTPWPYYVNDTFIPGIGRHGEAIINRFHQRYDREQQANPSTVINITQPQIGQ